MSCVCVCVGGSCRAAIEEGGVKTFKSTRGRSGGGLRAGARKGFNWVVSRSTASSSRTTGSGGSNAGGLCVFWATGSRFFAAAAARRRRKAERSRIAGRPHQALARVPQQRHHSRRHVRQRVRRRPEQRRSPRGAAGDDPAHAHPLGPRARAVHAARARGAAVVPLPPALLMVLLLRRRLCPPSSSCATSCSAAPVRPPAAPAPAHCAAVDQPPARVRPRLGVVAVDLVARAGEGDAAADGVVAVEVEGAGELCELGRVGLCVGGCFGFWLRFGRAEVRLGRLARRAPPGPRQGAHTWKLAASTVPCWSKST